MTTAFINSLASERYAVLGVVDPDAYAPGVHTTDYCDAGLFERLIAVLAVGTLSTGATINAKVVQATDSSGTSKKDISGKAVTALTAAGSDSDKQAIVNVKSDELDVANKFKYVALEITSTDSSSPAGTNDYSGLVIGALPRQGPADDNDLASVDEIVS